MPHPSVDEHEVAAIMTVMATAFAADYGEAWSAAQLRGSLVSGQAWTRITYVDDGSAIGFTLCRQAGPETELLLIGVGPAGRRRGVGRDLLAAVVRDSAARGAAAMFLEVRESNVAALALYRAAGFIPVGRRRDYYSGSNGRRFDALTLRRIIGD